MHISPMWTALGPACLAAISWVASMAATPQAVTAPAPQPRQQNPSPMVETTRPHYRLPQELPPGRRLSVDAGLPRPVEVFLPAGADTAAPLRVLIHFHGASYAAMQAAAASTTPTLAIAVHLGGAAAAYELPFSRTGALRAVVAATRGALERESGRHMELARVDLSAFSAGYGAVRALLGDPDFARMVDAVLLLDGLHASYVPDRLVLAEGGRIEPAHLQPFVALAQRAVADELAFTITHSEVFPGTFASTTEMTDALLAATGTARKAMLARGPAGMQQLSDTRNGSLRLLGFAGNSAPDHLDHLHTLPAWVDDLLPPRPARARTNGSPPPGLDASRPTAHIVLP